MKILQVTIGFPPYQTGGTDHLSYLLSFGLEQKDDVELYVLSGRLPRDYTADIESEIFENMRVRRVHSSRRKFLESRVPNVEISTYKNLYYEGLFEKFIKELKPDIVHFQHTIELSTSLIHIAKRYANKTIVSLQDFWYFCPRIHLLKLDGAVCSGPEFGFNCYYCRTKNNVSCRGLHTYKSSRGKIISKIPLPIKTFLKDRIQRKQYYRTEREYGKILPFISRYYYVMETLKSADYILSPSRFLKESYVKIAKINPSSVLTIPLGIVPFSIKKKNSFSKPVCFGFAGSPSKHKGSQLLFDVFKKIPEDKAKLEIWGKGWEAFSKKARLSKNIDFKGEYTHRNIGEVFSSFDVLVIPSIWGETFSFVAHEAFYAKMPVIASNIGVFPDIIQDAKNGFLFNVNDSESLLKSINIIVENPEMIKKLSKNIEKPKSAEEYVDEIFSMYKNIL